MVLPALVKNNNNERSKEESHYQKLHQLPCEPNLQLLFTLPQPFIEVSGAKRRIKVEEVIIVNSFYYCFLPFIISTINSLYIGFSNHQIIIFINFLSLMILLFIGLIIFRLLSLSFFLSLIYSVAIIITFIFVIMILDQSEILLRENYNFIPLGLLIILGVTGYLAYSICHDSVLSALPINKTNQDEKVIGVEPRTLG